MGYLVIKNGTNKKSYKCTNTCNKPRLRVSNSYVPITNNTKPTMRARVNGSYIADYKSYTYTGNRGTVTTGTTYLTRSSTSNTVYRVSTSTNVQTAQWTLLYLPIGYGNCLYGVVTSTCSNTGSGECEQYNYIRRGWDFTTASNSAYYATFTFNSGSSYAGAVHYGYTYSITSMYGYSFGVNEGRGKIDYLSTGTVVTVSKTTNTIYQTRSSTSGTSYGTKTTNKTLTSSSWG